MVGEGEWKQNFLLNGLVKKAFFTNPRKLYLLFIIFY